MELDSLFTPEELQNCKNGEDIKQMCQNKFKTLADRNLEVTTIVTSLFAEWVKQNSNKALEALVEGYPKQQMALYQNEKEAENDGMST